MVTERWSSLFNPVTPEMTNSRTIYSCLGGCRAKGADGQTAGKLAYLLPVGRACMIDRKVSWKFGLIREAFVSSQQLLKIRAPHSVPLHRSGVGRRPCAQTLYSPQYREQSLRQNFAIRCHRLYHIVFVEKNVWGNG